MTYRRRINSDAWHWMPECSWWPRGGGEPRLGADRGFGPVDFKEQKKKPTTHEFCDECLAKAKARSR